MNQRDWNEYERNACLYVRETGTIVDNGLYVVCVNAKVDDGLDIAELMQCFTQTEVDNEKFPVFSNRMKYLKHSEGGSSAMCRVMEEYAQEREQTLINKKIKNALDKGISPEMIVDVLDVSLEQVLELQKENASE